MSPPAILRSFFELPGEMRADLNPLAVRYPGTDLAVTYAVEMHHSEAAA